MTPTRDFEEYFNDSTLSELQLSKIKLVRKIIHDLYPEVKERVSYAMPGFYHTDATKATECFFLTMTNKNWLGFYGMFGWNTDQSEYEELGITFGKGSVRVPYDISDEKLRAFIIDISTYNVARFGFKLPDSFK